MSRIGKNDPSKLPSGVEFHQVSGQTIEAKGPKGVRSFTATDDVDLAMARRKHGHGQAARLVQAGAPAMGHDPDP